MQRDAAPLFSVLVTAYNREGHIERCVRSALDQDFAGFEVVVADDASTDATVRVLEQIRDPRLRVIRRPVNGGISAARETTVANARGTWLVVLDSDWELTPGALARLATVIEQLPPGVRMIRSMLQIDDGTTAPAVVPEGVTDYEARMRWLEELTTSGRHASDAGHCIHRDVYATGTHFHDRRGQFENLWEADLARTEPSFWVREVLGIEHMDAANSTTREANLQSAVPRLMAEAPDLVWQLEMMFDRHGASLARDAPSYRRLLLTRAALESLLAGDRRAGLRYTRAAARQRRADPKLWTTLVLGLIGPRTLASVKVYGRQLRGRRARAAPAQP